MAYDDNNIFAKILRGEADAYRVYENDNALAFLDVMPQSDGHTLVLPKAPAENLFDLEPSIAGALFQSTQIVARAVRAAFKPDGIIVTQFNGPAAGQSVFHIHMHIIPRYAGTDLRRHGRGMADTAILEDHAERIRAVLADS
jgi:histidine triad (HIT) family protein